MSVISKVIKMSARRLTNTTFTPSFIISISLFKVDRKTFLVVNFLETSQAYPDINGIRWLGFLMVVLFENELYTTLLRKCHVLLGIQNTYIFRNTRFVNIPYEFYTIIVKI